MLDDAELADRYFLEPAAAFVRGTLGEAAGLGEAESLRLGLARGLRIHRYKRSGELPRVRRVLGALRALAPSSLLDLGSGRGAFLESSAPLSVPLAASAARTASCASAPVTP